MNQTILHNDMIVYNGDIKSTGAILSGTTTGSTSSIFTSAIDTEVHIKSTKSGTGVDYNLVSDQDGNFSLRDMTNGPTNFIYYARNSNILSIPGLTTSGNVGIKQSAGTEALEVTGNIKATNSINTPGCTFDSNYTLKNSTSGIQRFIHLLENTETGSGNTGGDLTIASYTDAGLHTGFYPLRIKRSTGNVGINLAGVGTMPTEALEVTGNIKCSGNFMPPTPTLVSASTGSCLTIVGTNTISYQRFGVFILISGSVSWNANSNEAYPYFTLPFTFASSPGSSSEQCIACTCSVGDYGIACINASSAVYIQQFGNSLPDSSVLGASGSIWINGIIAIA